MKLVVVLAVAFWQAAESTGVEPDTTVVTSPADNSFPWPFVALGLAAVIVGAVFAFRPLMTRRR